MNKLITAIVLFGVFACTPKVSTIEKNSKAESKSYNVEFVRAARINGNPENNLSVVLLITPKNENSFPPILSMKLRYIEDGNETYVNLQKQEGKGMIQTVIYGKDVKDKNPKIHSIVKDKIEFDKYEDMLLLVFEFNDKIGMDRKEMGIIYGLWEKDNQNERVEKEYNFKIEKIDL